MYANIHDQDVVLDTYVVYITLDEIVHHVMLHNHDVGIFL